MTKEREVLTRLVEAAKILAKQWPSIKEPPIADAFASAVVEAEALLTEEPRPVAHATKTYGGPPTVSAYMSDQGGDPRTRFATIEQVEDAILAAVDWIVTNRRGSVEGVVRRALGLS